MMCSSTARPGCLIESNADRKSGDALKYKDIELFMVKHPEDPSRRELLLKVKHRLIKGRRNMGRAPIFTYTKRDDNLGLCVIQDVLTFAFEDNAFDSPDVKCSGDIWRWTEIPEHRLSVPIHFKKCLGDVCIFRGTTRSETHSIITDPKKPWKYKQAEDLEQAASGQAGFKDEGTFYKYRKGAAAEIRHLDEYSRNIVMGQNSGKSFASYVSIIHEDLRPENILWNEELGRALIIDFHRTTLKRRLSQQRPRAIKRRRVQLEAGSRDPKRLRVT